MLSIKAKEKSISLDYRAEGRLPETVVADAVRLRQIIINLVENAIKFTESDGVTVAMRLETGAENNALAVDVIDTGIGMSNEAAQKVLEPFSQVDQSITRRFGGTGLGLAIFRQLAEKMGGEVSVKSEEGRGSTLTVTIDIGSLEGVRLVEVDSEAVQKTPIIQEEADTPSIPPSRILVVDDGESNRQLVSLFLTRAGCEMGVAENGQIALDKIAASHFDAVLMDMQMPVIDGVTATKRLREQGCEIPVIALTANAMREDEEACLAAGFTGFLAKPISMDRLMTKLSEALGGDAETATASKDPATSENAQPQVQDISPAAPKTPSAPVLNTADNQRPEIGTTAAIEVAEVESVTEDQYEQIYQEVNNITNEISDLPIVESTLPTDDVEFLEIVQMFVDRLSGRLIEMRDAAARQDYAELAILGHWLKGAGGTAGFPDLTASGAAVEQCAKSRDAEGVAAKLAELKSVASRIRISDNARQA